MMDPLPPVLLQNDYYDYCIIASLVDVVHFLSDVMLNRPAESAMLTMNESMLSAGNVVHFYFTSNWDEQKMRYEMEYHGHLAVLAGFSPRINNEGN